MESTVAIPGSRQHNLKKSFKRGLRSLLTACSDEEFRRAFPSFTTVEQNRLQRLFVQVIASVHEDIEKMRMNMDQKYMISYSDQSRFQILQEEFESIFLETQAGNVLDNVEELVQEQSLDPLHSEMSNVVETAQTLFEVKKNEFRYLSDLLKKAEEQKRDINARLELMKKEKQNTSSATDLTNELRIAMMHAAPPDPGHA